MDAIRPWSRRVQRWIPSTAPFAGRRCKPTTEQPSAAFLEALGDDLNTPRANAELFACVRRLETGGETERAQAKGELLAGAGLLGFLGADPEAWFHGADAGSPTGWRD